MSKEDSKSSLNIRKSGLRSLNPYAGLTEEEIQSKNNKEAIGNDFEEKYRKLLGKRKKNAYIIRFIDCPEAFYITFKTFDKRDTGKYEACQYFTSINHPKINLESYNKARRKRVPELDKYSTTGKVPVAELMKLGATYYCGTCNKGPFTYEDLKAGRCVVIEDENSLNDFTVGVLVCTRCKMKYYS